MWWSPAGRTVCFAIVVTLGSVASARGQTVLLNTNGFEQPTFFPTLLFGQQSFTVTGSVLAAGVQGQTTAAGSQAVKITGSALTDNTTFSGGNFWYQPFTYGASYNPVASNTRYVQASAQVRTSGALVNGAPLPNDIPFAGLHFETWSDHFTSGQRDQQALTPIQVSALGEVMVFTNTATAGTSNSLFTVPGLARREEWQRVAAEFDFQNQTFRVYLDDMSTPLTFIRNGDGGPESVVDVPFRNTFGTSLSIAEQGMVAYYGHDLSQGFAPGNNFFVDDYLITASASPQLGAPVPEPGLVVAVGFAGVAAGGWVRRWRRGAKPRAA